MSEAIRVFYGTNGKREVVGLQQGPVKDVIIYQDSARRKQARIQEGILHSNEGANLGEVTKVYAPIVYEEMLMEFYITEEEAKVAGNTEEAKGIDFTGTKYEPLAFPQTVYMLNGKKAAPCFRLNTRPDEDGVLAGGRVFFPSKHWKSATEGEAVITSVIHQADFGFAKGYMVQYELPESTEGLEEWVIEKYGSEAPLLILEGTPHGDYVALYSLDTGVALRIVPDEGGNWRAVRFTPVETDVLYERYKRKQVVDLNAYIVEQRYGSGVRLEDLAKEFEESEFGPNAIEERQLNVVWEPIDSDEEENELLSKGIYAGLIKGYAIQLSTIKLYTFVHQKQDAMLSFTDDEWAAMAAAFTKANQMATNAITARLKKGKMRLRRMA